MGTTPAVYAKVKGLGLGGSEEDEIFPNKAAQSWQANRGQHDDDEERREDGELFSNTAEVVNSPLVSSLVQKSHR